MKMTVLKHNMRKTELLWLVWEITGRRTMELGKYLGARHVQLNSLLPKAIKDISLLVQTLALIIKSKPHIIVVASVRIAIFLILIKPILKFNMVFDCHYSGIVPGEKVPKIFYFFYPMVHRCADLIVVTNDNHADIIAKRGGNPFVLPDRIPEPMPQQVSCESSNNKKVVCICSFAGDEPINEIIIAAELLNNADIYFYLTGDSKDRFSCRELPPNVIFTGFLPEDAYWQLLWQSDVIVDLTTRDNCLVCGAYEAIAVEKPLILSNKHALNNYFSTAAMYTENNGIDIAFCIKSALESKGSLMQQVKEIKPIITYNWEILGNQLLQKLVHL